MLHTDLESSPTPAQASFSATEQVPEIDSLRLAAWREEIASNRLLVEDARRENAILVAGSVVSVPEFEEMIKDGQDPVGAYEHGSRD